MLLADGERLRVHALDASPPDGSRPPLTVVCVHGNPTWSLMWRSFHRRLGDRYRVLAVDQVSMGLSERTGPRTFAQRVDDLGRILDAFAVEGPVVLAAHDWGGPIALGWALEHRERVLRDPARQHRRRAAADRSAAADSPRAPSGAPRPRLPADVAVPPGDARHGTRAHRQGRQEAPTSRPYASSADRQAIADFVADIPTTPEHPSFAALAEVAARLPELDVPVLLAWGERDPVFHLGFAADLRRRLPQAELHRFPLAGHLVVEEEDVAALADAWIERLLEPKRPPAVVAAERPTPASALGSARRPRAGRCDRGRRRRRRLALVRRRSPTASPRSPRGCETPVSLRATASRCSRPSRPTSSPPPTPAG